VINVNWYPVEYEQSALQVSVIPSVVGHAESHWM